MKRLIESFGLKARQPRPIYRAHVAMRMPMPPPGFVRRSDPNFYFLARKY